MTTRECGAQRALPDRRAHLFGARVAGLALVALICATPPTSVGAQTTPTIELIQAVDSKALGGLNVPAFWVVTETPDGVRVLEGNHAQPAAIEVGVVDLPIPVAANALVEAFTAELLLAVPDLKVTDKVSLEGAKGIEQVYLEATGSETHAVRYGVVFVVGKHKAIVASLSAPEERFAAFAARDLLQEILASMR